VCVYMYDTYDTYDTSRSYIYIYIYICIYTYIYTYDKYIHTYEQERGGVEQKPTAVNTKSVTLQTVTKGATVTAVTPSMKAVEPLREPASKVVSLKEQKAPAPAGGFFASSFFSFFPVYCRFFLFCVGVRCLLSVAGVGGGGGGEEEQGEMCVCVRVCVFKCVYTHTQKHTQTQTQTHTRVCFRPLD
jgi:hypothetical protein